VVRTKKEEVVCDYIPTRTSLNQDSRSIVPKYIVLNQAVVTPVELHGIGVAPSTRSFWDVNVAMLDLKAGTTVTKLKPKRAVVHQLNILEPTSVSSGV
jgi:hypothetical protein